MAITVSANGGGDSTANSNQLTFTTTRTILTGEYVCVSVGADWNLNIPSSITVGSLTLNKDRDSRTNEVVALWSSLATGDIASGSTVTITFSGAASIGVKHGTCFSLIGTTGGPVDVLQSNSGTGSTALNSGTTAVTRFANAIAVAVVAFWGAGSSPCAPANGYTELEERTTGGDDLQTQYLVLSTVGTQQSQWTSSSTTTNYDAVVVVYKEVGNPFLAHRMPLGV